MESSQVIQRSPIGFQGYWGIAPENSTGGADASSNRRYLDYGPPSAGHKLSGKHKHLFTSIGVGRKDP